MSIVRRIISANIRLSSWVDKWLGKRFTTDGNSDFRNNFVERYLTHGATVYDIGGGRTPFLTADRKNSLSSYIVGVDISESELKAAPDGIYDRTIAEDICLYRGAGDGDLAICCAVLEHVKDTDAAIASIAACLKPGGTACIFAPSRNALFARLNLILPEAAKRAILFAIFPQTRTTQGFRSYYNECTLCDLQRLAEKHGLNLVEEKCYYRSTYFDFLFPLYLMWRIWVFTFYSLHGKAAAETFSLALKKR